MSQVAQPWQWHSFLDENDCSFHWQILRLSSHLDWNYLCNHIKYNLHMSAYFTEYSLALLTNLIGIPVRKRPHIHWLTSSVNDNTNQMHLVQRWYSEMHHKVLNLFTLFATGSCRKVSLNTHANTNSMLSASGPQELFISWLHYHNILHHKQKINTHIICQWIMCNLRQIV